MATNPWEMNWDAPVAAAPAQDPIVKRGGPDPYTVGRNAATDGRAETDQAIQIAKARRDDLEWNATHNADGSLKPKPEDDDSDKGKIRSATLESVVGQINRVQELYNGGVRDERIGNLWGALDNVGPSAGQFNSAGQGVADQGLAAFRVPGQGSQSDMEAKQFAIANTPQAGDYDLQIEEKLRTLRGRIDANRKALGMPPAQWTGMGEQEDGLSGGSVTDESEVVPGSPGGNTTAGGPPSGGGGIMDGLGAAAGDAVQTVGNIAGLVVNPVSAGINAAFGTDLSTDYGRSLRAATGLPDGDPLISAINQGGFSALAGAGMGSLVRGAGAGVQTVANALADQPLRQTIGAAAGSASGELVRQAGGNAFLQGAASLAGGIGGFAGANALANAGQRAARVPNALMQAADRQNVTLMPADVGGTGIRMAAGVAGRTLGEIPIREGANVALTSAKNARDRVAANVGQISDATGAGQAAQSGARRFIETSAQRGAGLFDNITVPNDANAKVDATRATLTDVIKGFTSNPALSKIWTGHPRLRETLKALTPVDVAAEGRRELSQATENLTAAKAEYDTILPTVSDPKLINAAREKVGQAEQAVAAAAEKANRPPEGGKVSWEDVKRLRSIVGEIIGQPSVTSDGNANAAMRKFYGALTTDMEATAAASGPRALTEFRRASQYWRGRQSRIDDVLTGILGNDGGKGEAAAFEQINRWAKAEGGDFKKLAQTIRSMPADEGNTIRATIISRQGQQKPGAMNPDGLEFSPAEWTTQWNKTDKRAKNVLFPNAEHRRDLNDLATIFGNMKQAGQYANNSNTALGTYAQGGIQTGLVGGVAGAVAAGAYAGGTYSLGKLLASPRFARWLASAPKVTTEARKRHILTSLGSIATKDPSIAAEVKALGAYLGQAMNDNGPRMGSVAAQPAQEDGLSGGSVTDDSEATR